MKKVLVTGSNGFVGRNLCSVLQRYENIELYEYDLKSKPEELDRALGKIDCIIHLAGVNRPKTWMSLRPVMCGRGTTVNSQITFLNRSQKGRKGCATDEWMTRMIPSGLDDLDDSLRE